MKTYSAEEALAMMAAMIEANAPSSPTELDIDEEADFGGVLVHRICKAYFGFTWETAVSTKTKRVHVWGVNEELAAAQAEVE